MKDTMQEIKDLTQDWLAARVADGTIIREEALRRTRNAARIRAQGAILLQKLKLREADQGGKA